MSTLLQDMMGLLKRKQKSTPKNEDFIAIARYQTPQEQFKPNPKVKDSLVGLLALKNYVNAGQDLASVLAVGNTAGTNDILLGLNQLQLVGDSIYQDGVLNIVGATGGIYFEDETGASMEFSAGFGLDIIGTSQLWLDTTTSDGTLKFESANGTVFSGTLGASLALTADRTWRLPDAEGTVALESAITEVLTFGGGSSGDVRTMTVTGGIITARTLVP